MKKSIWKFPLQIMAKQTIAMPKGAVVCHVGEQRGMVCLWAEVDTEAELEPVEIRIFGTGHPIPEEPGIFLGTVLVNGGTLVFHVYRGV